MKKEFGKWLMDVAKYMLTALLLSSVFGDMSKTFTLISVSLASILTLLVGRWIPEASAKLR